MKCSLPYKQNLAILCQLSDQATNAETRQNKKKTVTALAKLSSNTNSPLHFNIIKNIPN